MASFPLYIDLAGNNSTVFGGGEKAARIVRTLQQFQTAITVISPHLCADLRLASEKGEIRHIPRRYFRGDCNNSQLCIAATSDPTTNIAISTECKAKGIPVHVTNPSVYGNFHFPHIYDYNGMLISTPGDIPDKQWNDAIRRLSTAENEE